MEGPPVVGVPSYSFFKYLSSGTDTSFQNILHESNYEWLHQNFTVLCPSGPLFLLAFPRLESMLNIKPQLCNHIRLSLSVVNHMKIKPYV